MGLNRCTAGAITRGMSAREVLTKVWKVVLFCWNSVIVIVFVALLLTLWYSQWQLHKFNKACQGAGYYQVDPDQKTSVYVRANAGQCVILNGAGLYEVKRVSIR
jgi:hypothetical protein